MADNVIEGKPMADIGTDHGFLPMYLYENGICPKVILADVSQGSLNKARENCGICEGYDYRLGDGLSVLEAGEVCTVAVAGMGGRLICRILEKDTAKTKSFQRLILQPRNGQAELRIWLEQNGFVITSELLAREGRFICEIIVAEPSKDGKVCKRKNFGSIEYELPRTLLEQNADLGAELFERRLAGEKEILEALKLAESDTCEKQKAVLERIRYIEAVMAAYDERKR